MVDNEQLEGLHKKLTECLNPVPLEVAGRLLYYDPQQQIFILGVHSTGPDKTQQAATLAWDSIPEDLREELKQANIGFACKQI